MKNINTITKNFKMNGELFKKLSVVANSGSDVVAVLLEGLPGSGKTALTKAFADALDIGYDYIQCHNDISVEEFFTDISISDVIVNNSKDAVIDGILLKAIKQSSKGDLVLCIDEIDKTSTRVDNYLLDFIQNGRVRVSGKIHEKGEGKIYLFLTSNGERDLSDALRDRCKKIYMERLDPKVVSELHGVREDHHAITLYSKGILSFRQVQMYLEDIDKVDELDTTILDLYTSGQEIQAEPDQKKGRYYVPVREIAGYDPEFPLYLLQQIEKDNSIGYVENKRIYIDRLSEILYLIRGFHMNNMDIGTHNPIHVKKEEGFVVEKEVNFDNIPLIYEDKACFIRMEYGVSFVLEKMGDGYVRCIISPEDLDTYRRMYVKSLGGEDNE